MPKHSLNIKRRQTRPKGGARVYLRAFYDYLGDPRLYLDFRARIPVGQPGIGPTFDELVPGRTELIRAHINLPFPDVHRVPAKSWLLPEFRHG